MDRQLDFRALLLNIQDRLSSDDRRRLNFIIGDTIPRYLREDTTLGGTLNVLESLIDQAVIGEDYLEFLIRIFRTIRCNDAAKRLEDFQLNREPPKERKVTVSDVFDDNAVDDKYASNTSNTLVSVVINSTSLDRPEGRKLTTTDSPSIPIPSKKTPKMFSKSLITFCCYGLFFLQILVLLIYLWIYFHKTSHVNISENRFHRGAYIKKYGKVRDDINGKWFDYSENLSLTFADQLMRIDAYRYVDIMYSINFTYSNNKTAEYRLKNPTRLNKPTSQSLEFKSGTIKSITQCYKNTNGSSRLVGLLIVLNNNNSTLFGSCHEHIHEVDKFSNYVFGYVLAKMDQYLNGFQFVWYEICPINNQVTSCGDSDHYTLPSSKFYDDL